MEEQTNILCCERWNTERLFHIQQLTLKKETNQQLDKLRIEPNVLRFRVRYTTKKGDPLSRVYGNLVYHGPSYKRRKQATPEGYVYESIDHPLEDEYDGGTSLQGLPVWIRRLIASEHYRDFDVVNCAPVLLQQILEREGVPVPFALASYNAHRQLLFTKYHQVATPGEIKKAFLEVIHMGNVDERFEECIQLKQSLREALVMLSRCANHKDLYVATVRKVFNSTKQKYFSLSEYSKVNKALGKFCAVVWQRQEHLVLMAMRHFFIKEQGCNPLHFVLCFDGLMVERTEVERAVDLTLLSSYICKETGFVVEVIEKSMLPTQADWDIYHGKSVSMTQ